MSTWQFDVDICFYAQYGIRRSQAANTVVRNLPWLWIIILGLPIRGFANNFHQWFCSHVNHYQITVVGSFPKNETNDLKCNTAVFPIHQ